MADQIFNSSIQKHYIDPWNQRVFQFDTDRSDVFLSRVANSVYNVFGDDIVMSGLTLLGLAHTTDSVTATLTSGDILQDNTLIQVPEDINLKLEGLSGLDDNGRVVVLSNFRYLETFEKNDQHFQINYINSNGSPLLGFDVNRDRLLLGIYKFIKDGSDNIIGFTETTETELAIDGHILTLRGFTDENRRLTQYLKHQLFSANLSVVIDPIYGIKLRNDEADPGSAKYYGTGANGQKGFFDISTLAFDNESTIPEYQAAYNQMLYNGNLFFIAPGHDISEFLTPPVPLVYVPVFDNTMWEVAAAASWDPINSKWLDDAETPESIQLIPLTGTYWPIGFRPSKIKITGIVSSVQTIEVYDALHNLLGSGLTGPEIEIDLGFSVGSDINMLNLYGFVEVLSIEFLGGTLGIEPSPPPS